MMDNPSPVMVSTWTRNWLDVLVVSAAARSEHFSKVQNLCQVTLKHVISAQNKEMRTSQNHSKPCSPGETSKYLVKRIFLQPSGDVSYLSFRDWLSIPDLWHTPGFKVAIVKLQENSHRKHWESLARVSVHRCS